VVVRTGLNRWALNKPGLFPFSYGKSDMRTR
jgi:hypothetical protein